MLEYKTKEYHRTKAKEHYWKNKSEYQVRNAEQRAKTRQLIQEAKLPGCRMCPETYALALDFHHLGDKDMSVSQMRGMNDERVTAEIAKCVVLCKNCHAKVHGGVLVIDEI
jgi:hypothetical protein